MEKKIVICTATDRFKLEVKLTDGKGQRSAETLEQVSETRRLSICGSHDIVNYYGRFRECCCGQNIQEFRQFLRQLSPEKLVSVMDYRFGYGFD